MNDTDEFIDRGWSKCRVDRGCLMERRDGLTDLGMVHHADADYERAIQVVWERGVRMPRLT